jgi:perosamine synthetase
MNIQTAQNGHGRRPPRHQPTDHVTALEEAIAAAFGVPHAIAVSHGTAALHCALLACGVGPGDEVLIPAACVVMSAAPVLYCGARPVFVDCANDGIGMDPSDLEAKITPQAKAIMAVDLWGRCGDMAWLSEFAAARGLRLIEDACQAHGTQFADKPAGSWGDAAALSLHHAKLIECGEGGIILTSSDAIAEHCRAVRTHWQVPPLGQAPMSSLGYNYRLAEPLADLAAASLASFPQTLARRKTYTATLIAALTGLPGLTIPAHHAGQDWNHYSPLFRLTLARPREFCEHLDQCGVPNSTGTFKLVACDQRPLFAAYASARPCTRASAMIDAMLAVVLTNRDTGDQIARYAEIITVEARRWTT